MSAQAAFQLHQRPVGAGRDLVQEHQPLRPERRGRRICAGRPAQTEQAIAAARAALPAWATSTCRRAPTCSTRSATRSWRARTSSGSCCRARKARPCPRAWAKWRAPATSSSSSPAKCCGAPASWCRRCAPASTWRSRASRSAWWASSRRGISRQRFRPGRSRRRSPTGIASCSSLPIWCLARPGRWRRSSRAPGCRPVHSTWSMGRGSVVGEALVNDPRVDAISFTGSVDTGQKIAQKAVARMAKFQLEMGGKNPLVVLDDADLKTAVESAVNGAFFSTGPAVHGVLAPDRDQGHSQRIRRSADRAAQGDAGRQRAQGRHADGSGGGQESAQPGSVLHRGRQERGRQARVWRQSAEAREGRLLPGAGAVHRDAQQHAHQSRRSLRAGRDRASPPRITTRRCNSPTTPRSDYPPASLRLRSSTRHTSAATARPAW